jgi:hypothetical protein
MAFHQTWRVWTSSASVERRTVWSVERFYLYDDQPAHRHQEPDRRDPA